MVASQAHAVEVSKRLESTRKSRFAPMTDDGKVELSELRRELALAAATADVAERALGVVAIVAAVAAPLGITPVLVGGMAVYFWTRTDAFLTHDIDVVMDVPTELQRKLEQLGFTRSTGGRHWTLKGTEVFLEAPSAALDPDAVVVDVEMPSGRSARVLSRVDVLISRLAEFQATGHEDVGLQVLVLLDSIRASEWKDLQGRAASHRLTRILDAMHDLGDELAGGRVPPDSARAARDCSRCAYG
jgi:hypothetical protein